eukprot:gene5664-biopygen13282
MHEMEVNFFRDLGRHALPEDFVLLNTQQPLSEPRRSHFIYTPDEGSETFGHRVRSLFGQYLWALGSDRTLCSPYAPHMSSSSHKKGVRDRNRAGIEAADRARGA